jgi:hypothetical protein
MRKLISINSDKYFFFVVLIFFLLFSIIAQFYGGFTVDEPAQYLRAEVWIKNFFIKSSVYNNSGLPKHYLEHTDTYGLFTQILSLTLSYIFKSIISVFGITFETKLIFHYFLHFTSIFFGFLSIIIFFNFLKLLNIDRREAYYASIIFASTPVWLGHSFFNYMDINLAFFFLSSSYFLFKINFEKKIKDKYILFYSLSLLGIGVTRPQILPIFFLLSISVLLLKRIKFLNFIKYGLITLILLYIMTPQSWPEPILWINNVYFDNLAGQWSGCSQTNNECIGKTHSENWSALKYFGIWLSVKIPLIILIFFFFLFQNRDKKQLLIFFIFLIPFLIIIFKNLNLYNGIRHFLFLLPIIYLISFRNFILYVKNKKIKLISFLILFISLMLDNLSLYPYNYTYLNYLARYNALSEIKMNNKIFALSYELDYWGYSLKESVKNLEKYSKSETIYVDFPKFWDPIILPLSNKLVIKNDKVETYYYISPIYGVGDGRKVPENCKLIDTTSRKYFLDNKRFHFSYFAKCHNKQ